MEPLPSQREELQSAMAACRSHTQRVQQALGRALQEEAMAHEKLRRAEEAFRLKLARIPQVPSNNVEALKETLETLRRRCDVLERSMSFDLFERWRRRLDWELRASGRVEDANSVGLPSAEQGWALGAELAAKTTSARQAAELKQQTEGQLMEAVGRRKR